MQKLSIAAAAFALVMAGSGSAQAATLFELTTCHTGNCGDVTGQVDVLITDVAPDDVQFDVDNDTNGHIDYLSFYYTGTLPDDGSILAFTVNSGSVEEPSVSFGGQTDAGLLFNINFDFENSNSGGGALRFDAGESISMVLSGTLGGLDITLNDEDFTLALAHVGGIGTNGEGSVKLIDDDPNDPNDPNDPVPEPTTMALLGIGLLAAGFARRRR
jgi:hypothetical protein